MRFLARIETKVYAAMVGAGAGSIIATAGLWLLGVFVWHASKDASAWQAAVAAVPQPVAEAEGLAVTVLGVLIGGYAAPPSNHAGNNATGEPMDDLTAGHPAEVPAAPFPFPTTTTEG